MDFQKVGGRDNIIFYVKYRYRPLRVPVLGFYLYSVLQLVSLSCTSKITNLCVSGPSSAYSTPHHHHTLSSPAYPGGSDEATSTRAVVVSSTYTPSSTPIQTPPEVSAASALLPVTASPSPPTPRCSCCCRQRRRRRRRQRQPNENRNKKSPK